MTRGLVLFLVLCGLTTAAGCAGVSGVEPRGLAADALPIDLDRFMGDWYVVAHIPTPTEAEAFEAVERYALREDGTIEVRFLFCEGGFDGPAETVEMTGWVHDPATNAEWRVRPLWPLALQYQISELDPAYQRTVVVNPGGGYAWVMARQREIPEAELESIVERLARDGYETARLRRVPHRDGACLRAGAAE